MLLWEPVPNCEFGVYEALVGSVDSGVSRMA